MLKKEFKRKDVERMRNLITGNAGSSSETQIGYKKKTIEYKEGDVWTENKKTWTIKNGIKQTISKLDRIKKEVFVPLFCPECSKVMKHHLDKDNYKVHKKCHDCVVEYEHKLMLQFKHDEYIKEIKVKNSLDIVKETESYLLEAINERKDGYVSENGEVENWVGGINQKELTKKVKEAAKLRIEHLNKELNELREGTRTKGTN
jgi:hypothetical protein